MQVYGVEAFQDNYIWVIREKSGHAVIVDPGDAGPVIDYLEKETLIPRAILITHKHGDHVGGIALLKQRYPDIIVYGPIGEPIAGLDIMLSDGQQVVITGMDYRPYVMAVPGHTEGHIAYYTAGTLFCGDTLFACGCGRVFSGTMSQLYQSLTRISQLPLDTQLFCAHEYTLDNIGFAKWVEPHNKALLAREQQATEMRASGLSTVPSSLALEVATNPFLRVGEDDVIQAAQQHVGRILKDGREVFQVLRTWKDQAYD